MSGPGSVGFPIQIGAQEVDSGDMIVADRDGVFVVPFQRLDDVVANQDRIKGAETVQDDRVVSGLRVQDWVEQLLASDQVVYEE